MIRNVAEECAALPMQNKPMQNKPMQNKPMQNKPMQNKPMQNKMLSVCIPTHDGRGGTLRDALESVVSQLDEALRHQIEICISDNASQDETWSVVEQYSQKYPGLIRYHRNPENLGFTRNLMQVIGLSQARFCWLLSSDDALAPLALSCASQALEQHPSLSGMTVGVQICDRSLTPNPQAEQAPSLLPEYPGERHLYSAPDQIFRECGSVMGYTSAQVFDRSLWHECLQEISPEKFNSFTYFPYLYLFGKMVKKKPQWLWLPEKLALSRSNNDYLSSHLSANKLKYHRLTMEEISQVWGALFGRNSATYRILMRNNYVLYWNGPAILHYKLRTFSTAAEEWRALFWFPRRLYFLPSLWLVALPVLLTPHRLVQSAAALARKLKMQNILRAMKRRFFQT